MVSGAGMQLDHDRVGVVHRDSRRQAVEGDPAGRAGGRRVLHERATSRELRQPDVGRIEATGRPCDGLRVRTRRSARAGAERDHQQSGFNHRHRRAATPEDGPTGGFFRDGRPISW
jgi:hypothetical protein